MKTKYTVRNRDEYGDWVIVRYCRTLDEAEAYLDRMLDDPNQTGEQYRVTNWTGTRMYSHIKV